MRSRPGTVKSGGRAMDFVPDDCLAPRRHVALDLGGDPSQHLRFTAKAPFRRALLGTCICSSPSRGRQRAKEWSSRRCCSTWSKA